MDPIECELCHGLFCLKHKLESDHKCPKAVRLTMDEINKKNRELVRKRMAEMKKKKGK